MMKSNLRKTQEDKTVATETGRVKVDDWVELYYRRYEPLEGLPKATILIVNGTYTNKHCMLIRYRIW
jgi:hypothetical protein